MNYYTVQDILQYITGKVSVCGPTNRIITHPAPIDSANEFSVAFCDCPGVSAASTRPFDCIDDVPVQASIENIQQTKTRINNSLAGVIFIPETITPDCSQNCTFIIVKNPRLQFVSVVARLFTEKVSYGIHPTAYIEDNTNISDEIYIGPFVCIERNVSIEKGTQIYGHTYIFNNVSIGKNVIIKSGTVIGGQGFGMWKRRDGSYLDTPQIGGVIIEDNVFVGSNCVIDCGTFAPTRIGKGSKIDSLVFIAHNTQLEENCVIVGGAMTCGGVRLRQGAWVGPGASILNQTQIGKNSIVGMGAAVTKHVEDNSVVAGVPAKEIKKRDAK